MCGLDELFNLLLIFPSRRVGGFVLPGANLGVAGAALGTALAQTVTVLLLLYFLLARSPILHLRKEEKRNSPRSGQNRRKDRPACGL